MESSPFADLWDTLVADLTVSLQIALMTRNRIAKLCEIVAFDPTSRSAAPNMGAAWESTDGLWSALSRGSISSAASASDMNDASTFTRRSSRSVARSLLGAS
jgi:hypothetical protein